MFFRAKKELISKEYEELVSRVRILEGTVEGLKFALEQLSTNVHSLRGLINRKLGKNNLDEESDSGMSKDELSALRDFALQMGYNPKG